MSIQSGASVRLEYSVHDATGDLFETSADHGAVETVIGSGELPAGVESALIGGGKRRTVSVAEDGAE